jgi:hypothetical protein
MKRVCCVLVLVLVVFALPLSAQANKTFGLIFEMNNLLVSIGPYNDSYQAGAGLKWWAAKNLAFRGLVNLDFNSNAGVTTMDLGFGAAVEFHPTPNKASPYLGGLVGTRVAIAAGNAIDLYLGGLGGVEVNVWENIGMYAEYALLLSIDANGVSVGIGPAGGARLGIIVYF